jgi:hypothetical protein
VRAGKADAIAFNGIYFWNRQIERRGKETFLLFERACYS